MDIKAKKVHSRKVREQQINRAKTAEKSYLKIKLDEKSTAKPQSAGKVYKKGVNNGNKKASISKA